MWDDDIIVKTFLHVNDVCGDCGSCACLWGVLFSLCVCVYAGMKQHNDHGTQYRSAIYTSSPTQQELALKSKVVYQQVLYQHTHDKVSTCHLKSHDVIQYITKVCVK